MSQFLLTWIITALSLVITAYLIPGIVIKGLAVAAIAALVMGLINAIVKPILLILTLPLTVLTLGLFLFVVNAISFSLVSYFTPGFSIATFWDALFGSIILSIISSVLNQLLDSQDV
ncbi:MAG: phage holin family protein [Crocosphaera sp.]|nr:phage holin family protein [Crocosphaera sp.]